jgi:hypothetical protein
MLALLSQCYQPCLQRPKEGVVGEETIANLHGATSMNNNTNQPIILEDQWEKNSQAP